MHVPFFKHKIYTNLILDITEKLLNQHLSLFAGNLKSLIETIHFLQEDSIKKKQKKEKNKKKEKKK